MSRVLLITLRYMSFKNILLFAVVVYIALSSAQNAIIYAITPAESRRSIRMGTEYYNKDDSISCSEKNTQSFDGEDVDIDTSKIYNSGLDPNGPFILEQFAIHILKASAAKLNKPEEDLVTKQHVIALVAFAIGEGGDINNASVFNPLNLSYKSDDIVAIPWLGDGGGGEQAYKTFDQGVEAYARQINMGYQSRIGKVLSKKDTTAADFMHAITYYKEYRGNLAWAEASIADPDAYYNKRMEYVRMVRNNYEKTAGFVIGTDKEEQDLGMYKPSLLQFKDVKNDSVDEYTQTQFDDPCQNEQNSNGSPTGTGWDLKGPNKMVFYRQDDPKWASHPFPCNKSPTIGGCGCWAVTSASIISTLSNKKVNPKELVDEFRDTTWLLTPPQKYGLNSVNIGTDLDKAEKTLRNGGLVGMYVTGGGTFTSNIHMMVLRKVSDDGKLFYVYDLYDPSSDRNTKGYTRQELMNPGNLNEMYAVTKKGKNDQ